MSTHSPEQSTFSNEPIGPKMKNNQFVFNIPHSNEEVSVDNAPKGKLDERRVKQLVEQGVPRDPSSIDPLTGKVDFIPLSEQKSEKQSRGKLYATLGAVGAGLAFAAVAVLGRGGSAEPVTPENKPTPTASGNVVPGPDMTPSATNSPEVSQTTDVTEPIGAAERENTMFEQTTITGEMIEDGFFQPYTAEKVAPAALETYRGDGKDGLFENFDDNRRTLERAIAGTTAEDMADWQERVNEILDAKYTKIVDGEPVRDVPATEVFTDGGYLTTYSQDSFETIFTDFNMTSNKARADYLANTLANADIFNVKGALSDIVKIEKDIKEYNQLHTDDQIAPSPINASAIAQNRFVDPTDDKIVNEVFTMTDAMRAGNDPAVAVEGKAYIVKTYDMEPELSADKSASFTKKANIVFYENTAGQMVMKALVPIPVERVIVSEPGLGASIQKVSNKFVYVQVAQRVQ